MDVGGFTIDDLTVGNGLADNFDGGPAVYTADITSAGKGAVTIDIADDVCHSSSTGAPNMASEQFSIVYDSVGPTVSLSSVSSDPTADYPIPLTITFNEDVTGLTAGEISVGNGSAGNLLGGPQVYTAEITPDAPDVLVTINVAAGVCQDAAGNDNQDATQISRYYTEAPSVTINQAVGQADPTNSTTINFTVVFSESVSDFATGDVTLSGTAGASVQGGSLATSDNINWTVNIISSAAGSISVTVGAGVCSDPAGNTNNAAGTPLARTFITSISWGGATNSYSGTTPITTVALNITNQSSRILMVGISFEKEAAGAITVSSVAFNSGGAGTALAAVPGATRTYTSGNNSYITTIWYVVNPPIANATITVTFSDTPRRARVAACWAYNVNTGSPFGAIAGSTATVYPATTISTPRASTYYYSMLIDNVVGSEGSNTHTTDEGQTSIWTNGTNGSSSTAGGSRKAFTSTGTTTMGWTFNNQTICLMQTVVELKIIQ